MRALSRKLNVFRSYVEGIGCHGNSRNWQDIVTQRRGLRTAKKEDEVAVSICASLRGSDYLRNSPGLVTHTSVLVFTDKPMSVISMCRLSLLLEWVLNLFTGYCIKADR